jgi:hypothetical protein
VSTTTTPVSIAITPEVRAYVAELGMQAEFEQMLEYLQQTVSHLRGINLYLDGPYDDGDVPCVIFDAQLTQETPVIDGTRDRWGEWFMNTFPRKAFGRFQLLFTPPGPDHAG